MAVERPSYSVEMSMPPYEIRDYAPTLVALVHVGGDRSDAVSAGFRILANYIFGNNRTAGKIAMTAPVTQSPGHAIAMTAPVQQQSTQGGWEVRFTMPAAYTMTTLPMPNDARVQIVQVPKQRMAVVKFSGFWSDANLQSHAAQLLEWLKSRHFTALSAPAYAYYDPPWTPWFLRTIEVLVEIAPTPSAPAPS